MNNPKEDHDYGLLYSQHSLKIYKVELIKLPRKVDKHKLQ